MSVKSFTSFIKKISNSQTTKMWLVSYILILLVPIIFSFFSYYYVENSLSKKINEANTNNLNSAGTYMDNILNGIVSATVSLSSNEQIKSLASTGELTTSAEIYLRNIALSDSNQVWRAHSIFSDFITNKYIYLPNTDSVYTGSILTDSEYYLTNTYSGLRGFDAQAWQEKLFYVSKPGFITIPIDEGTELFYVYPAYNNKTDAQFYTIVHLNMNALTKNASRDNNAYFYVQNDHDIITSSELSQAQREAIMKSVSFGGGQYEIDTITDKMTIIKSPSQNSTLLYGFAIPSSTYRTEVERARMFMWTSSIICIFIALIIIIYLVNKNNRPLEVIAKTLSGNNEEQQYTDTYQYISEAISRSMSEKAQYADKLHKQHDILRENILTNILYGKTNDKFTSDELLNMINVNMPHNMFVTIAMCPNALTNMFNDEKYIAREEEKQKMAQFIISNILEEAIGEHFITETVTMSSLVIAIVNFPDDRADRLNNTLTTVISKSFELIEKEFGFCVHAAISNPHIGLEKLNDCYNESVLCMEYAINSDNRILFYDELDSGNLSTTIYSSEIETEIANSLAENDYMRCKKVIENHIYNFQLNKSISPEMARAFSYDLLSTFFRHLISSTNDRSRQFLAGVELGAIMSEGKTASAIMLKTIATIEKYLEGYDKEVATDTSQKSDFYQRIKKYIDENYSNTELTVSELAMLFKTNSSYLSSRFKKEFDIGLSDYITEVRIEAAKKLLVTTNMPNTEISLLAGYSNTRTFLRAFSKAEGITPKEYRRLNNPAV